MIQDVNGSSKMTQKWTRCEPKLSYSKNWSFLRWFGTYVWLFILYTSGKYFEKYRFGFYTSSAKKGLKLCDSLCAMIIYSRRHRHGWRMLTRKRIGDTLCLIFASDRKPYKENLSDQFHLCRFATCLSQ